MAGIRNTSKAIALIALYTVLTTLALNTHVQAAAAGPHHRGAWTAAAHRRHHARAAARSAAADTAAGVVHFSERDELEGEDSNEVKRDGVCELGAWKCVGTELQRCYNDQWNFVTNCTGTNIVCSDALYTTGCVWTWNVQDTDSSTSSSSSLDSASISTEVSPLGTASESYETPAISVTANASSSDYLNATATVSQTGLANVTASPTNVNLIASPSAPTSATASSSDNDDEEEECEDEDDDDDNNDDGEDQEDYEDDDDDDDDEDLPYCDEVEDGDSYSTTPVAGWSTPVVTTTQAVSTTAPTSTIGGQLWAGGDDSTSNDSNDTANNTDDNASADDDTTTNVDDNEYDDEDEEECEEVDESAFASTTSATATSATVDETATASTSIIGGQLWAGDDDYSDSDGDSSDGSWDSVTATATSTSASSSKHGWGGQHGWGNGHYGWGDQSSTTSSTDWVAEVTSTSSSATWDDSQWTPSTALTTASATASATANATDTGSNGWDDESYTVSSTSRHNDKWDSETVTATATGSAASSTSTGKSSPTTPLGSYSAPHYVIYADEWLYDMPSVSDLASYNRFILAFWMSNQGAVDDAQFWEWLDASTRAQVLQEYHDAGIALMVSAFGSTDSPTSDGADPTETAQKLAKWVKEYGLDGVDIDYEDMTAMNSAKAVAWLVTFQTELRRLLPSPYIITHAPVAPWFTSANDYSDGAYVAIHQQVGDGIDFYNIQFYNQGDGVYGDCETLLNDSGNDWPSTSVFEINSYAGVPLNKIVIGKPLDEGAASNGFVDPSVLNTCVSEAQAKGWNGGVMFWEWTSSAPSIMATVRGTQ
ncbi:hypothetical protein IAU59_003223 [Kwoniella sp. CBS 9459]